MEKIKNNNSINIGEELTIEKPNNDISKFTFEKLEFTDNKNYNIESCDASSNCSITTKNIKAPDNSKILYIEFTSQDYEGVQLAKFTSNYGKIIYTSSDGFSKEVVPTSVLANRDYLGKMLYIKVPNEIESAKTIDFIYTVRNNKYSYKIR